MNKIVKMVCRTCVYLIGFSVLLYPTVSKYVNTLHGTSVVNDYQQQISRTTEDQENQMLKDARAYNKRLISSYGTEPAGDPFAPGIRCRTYGRYFPAGWRREYPCGIVRT